jgi:heme exporter protein A
MSELSAHNLHLWRGDTHVLRGVSFALQGGQCLQVTGANGTGKTTLLRALSGLAQLEEGQVRWDGAPIARDLGSYHGALAYLGHDNGLKGDLSAHENLRFGVGLRRSVSASAIDAALAQLGVAAQRDLPLRQLSAGQRRRVALARLVLLAAPLWILDEPTANLDSAGHTLIESLLHSHLDAQGMAVVATHQPLERLGERLRGLQLS